MPCCVLFELATKKDVFTTSKLTLEKSGGIINASYCEFVAKTENFSGDGLRYCTTLIICPAMR